MDFIRYPTLSTYEYNQLHWFSDMKSAFEFADGLKNEKDEKDLVVFAYELQNTKRRYLVTGWKTFECYYAKLTPDKRLFHEMMRPHQPCRALYVDLDCKKAYNHHIEDFTVLIEETIQLLLEGLNIYLDVDPEKVDVTFTQASNDEKFSVHLLFEINSGKTYWKNNKECGKFVKRMISTLSEQDSILYVNESHKNGITKKDVIGKKCCIDDSIYGENRTYRMWLSTKMGETRPMIRNDDDLEIGSVDITGTNPTASYDRSKINNGGKSTKKQEECGPKNRFDTSFFRQSLVTYFPTNFDFRTATPIELEDSEFNVRSAARKDNNRTGFNNPKFDDSPFLGPSSSSFSSRSSSFSNPSNKVRWVESKPVSLPKLHHPNDEDGSKNNAPNSVGTNLNVVPALRSRLLDNLPKIISELLSKEEYKQLYYLSLWTWDDESKTLLVGSKNKYCTYYNSTHTNNNTYWIFDFNRFHYHRRCHSPNCKNNAQDLMLMNQSIRTQFQQYYESNLNDSQTSSTTWECTSTSKPYFQNYNIDLNVLFE